MRPADRTRRRTAPRACVAASGAPGARGGRPPTGTRRSRARAPGSRARAACPARPVSRSPTRTATRAPRAPPRHSRRSSPPARPGPSKPKPRAGTAIGPEAADPGKRPTPGYPLKLAKSSPIRSIRSTSPGCRSGRARSGSNPGAPTSTRGPRPPCSTRWASTSTCGPPTPNPSRSCCRKAASSWRARKSPGARCPMKTRPQFVNEAKIRTDLLALHNHGLRPLILLNANSGMPGPAKQISLSTVAEAPAGATDGQARTGQRGRRSCRARPASTNSPSAAAPTCSSPPSAPAMSRASRGRSRRRCPPANTAP